jgi:hypothetical protein
MHSFSLTLLLLLSWSILLAGPGQAQNDLAPSPTEYPLPSALQTIDEDVRFVLDIVSKDRSLFYSDSFLMNNRPGDRGGHAASIVQVGRHNQTTLDQTGQQHVASIAIFGDGNAVFAEQYGAQNQLGLRIDGHDNTLPVIQDGTGLQLSLELQSVNGLSPVFPITQTGSGVPIYIQVRSGSGGTP